MAVPRKGKRTIKVHKRKYLWWIDDSDIFSPGAFGVRVVDPDTNLIFCYEMGQSQETAHVTFQLDPRVKCGGYYRVRSPVFGGEKAFTPKHVRQLIEWVESESLGAQEVDYLGTTIFADSERRRGDEAQ